MATIKEQTEKTERLKTSLDNKVDSIGNIINTKIKERPTTLTQVEDVLSRKMLGIGDMLSPDQYYLDEDFSEYWNLLSNCVMSPREEGKQICISGNYIYVVKDNTTINRITLSGVLEKTYYIYSQGYPYITVSDNFLYIAYTYQGNSNITKMNVDTGETEWSKKYGDIYVDEIKSNSAHLYAVSRSTSIICIDKSNGNILWDKTDGNNPISAFFVTNDNILCNYYNAYGGKTTMLTSNTGEIVWKKQIGENTTDFAVNGNRVYTTNDDSKVRVLALSNGEVEFESKAYNDEPGIIRATEHVCVDSACDIHFTFKSAEIIKLRGNAYAELYRNTEYADIMFMGLTDVGDMILLLDNGSLIKKKNPTMCPIIKNI